MMAAQRRRGGLRGNRTGLGRAGAALIAWALVMAGHLSLADPARFGLWLAVVVAVAVLAGGRPPFRLASGRPGTPPGAAAAPDAGEAAAVDHDTLRRLEAELHALEDQLRSAADGVPAGPRWDWAAAGPARG